MKPMQLSYPLIEGPMVIRHPKVATRIIRYEFPLETMIPPTTVDSYERGTLICAPTITLPLSPDDWNFLNEINSPSSDLNVFKKAKTANLLKPIDKTAFDRHVLSYIFRGDIAKARRMQEMITTVNKTIRKHIRVLFSNYIFVGEDITWRLTPNEGEGIHYDFYGNEDDAHHHVRLFINIDNKPRLWGVSHDIATVIGMFPERVRAQGDVHPNRLTESLTKSLPWDEIDRHFVAFAPGNAWMVDSRKVAHEIIFGRKMIACSFLIDPKSMNDPSKSFVNVTNEAVRRIKHA